MQKKTIRRIALFSVIGTALLMVFLMGASSEKQSREMQKEMDALTASVSGAMDTIVHMGTYESKDGKVDSLSAKEKERILQEYEANVKRYYSKEHPSYTNYPEWNRDLIENRLRDSEEQCFDAGVLWVDPLNVQFNDAYIEADIEALVVDWNKWIRDEGGHYSIFNPMGRTLVKFHMVKEDGVWKVQKTLQFDQLDTGYDEESIRETYRNAPRIQTEWERFKKSLLRESEVDVREKIQRNIQLMDRQYDSYPDALNAAKSLDVQYNYYMLF